MLVQVIAWLKLLLSENAVGFGLIGTYIGTGTPAILFPGWAQHCYISIPHTLIALSMAACFHPVRQVPTSYMYTTAA